MKNPILSRLKLKRPRRRRYFWKTVYRRENIAILTRAQLKWDEKYIVIVHCTHLYSNPMTFGGVHTKYSLRAFTNTTGASTSFLPAIHNFSLFVLPFFIYSPAHTLDDGNDMWYCFDDLITNWDHCDPNEIAYRFLTWYKLQILFFRVINNCSNSYAVADQTLLLPVFTLGWKLISAAVRKLLRHCRPPTKRMMMKVELHLLWWRWSERRQKSRHDQLPSFP